MKKLSLVIVLVLALAASFAQTFTEDFETWTVLTGSYTTGTFTNQTNNITWSYGESREEGEFPIAGKGLMLRRASDSYLEATFPNGVGTFTFQYRKAHTGASPRQLELLVNGSQVATTTEYGGFSGEDPTIHNFSHDVNTGGQVTIKIKNTGTTTGNRQTVLDNITWTEYAGTEPTWSVTPGFISGLDYVLGNGPSAYQSFVINGSNLTDGYFMVSVPELSNFEIAREDIVPGTPDGYWGPGPLEMGNDVPHTIYVRMKADLPVGDYDADALVSYFAYDAVGETQEDKFVTLNGSVTAPPSTDPVWEVTPLELTGFTYFEGMGPSKSKYFTISGSNLVDNFMVNAPASGHYLISLNNTDFVGELELIPTEGAIQQRIYVRLEAGLPQGDYTWYNNEPQRVQVSMQTPVPTDPVYVTLSGSVGAPLVRHWVDFENEGEVKGGYALGQLILSNLNWELDEVLVASSPDTREWYDGNRSARFYGKATSRMTMLEDKAWGGGDISFQYRKWDGGDTQTAWVVEYSVDQGTTWIQIGDPFTPTDQVQTFTGTINNSRDIRLQFRIANDDGGTSYRRWNLDNIDLSDYYDFFKDVPTVVGEVEAVEITMLSNHANYSRTYTPGPVPVPDFNVMFHDCLTLLGEGPWEIDTDIILNKQPDSYWAAYKLHDTWYAEEMVGGHARLNVPAGTFAANNEIELLIGYGKNPTVPVELSSFTATINAENYVLLTWVSQSESNISGYNVYRNTSDDLSSAIKISDLIQGTNSSEATTYTYLDQELEQSGTYYYWLQNVDLDGTMSFYGPVNVVFSVDEEGGSPEIPFATKLENAYPNPFNPNTNIRYQLKDAGDVKIDIYNTRGQLVRSFSRTHDAPGYYQINWDGRDSSGKSVSSGVYQYKMTSGKYSATKKMVLKK
jgi:hypothetical protein